jgi:hypothetical protein
MAKIVNDAVLDGALDVILNNATRVSVCAAQPTTYTEAVTTNMLAIKDNLTSGDYTGPADDATGGLGRKLTMNQQASITVTNSGDADHVALCGTVTSNEVLYYVTTCTPQTLTSGNTVTVPAWKIQIADPT